MPPWIIRRISQRCSKSMVFESMVFWDKGIWQTMVLQMMSAQYTTCSVVRNKLFSSSTCMHMHWARGFFRTRTNMIDQQDGMWVTSQWLAATMHPRECWGSLRAKQHRDWLIFSCSGVYTYSRTGLLTTRIHAADNKKRRKRVGALQGCLEL